MVTSTIGLLTMTMSEFVVQLKSGSVLISVAYVATKSDRDIWIWAVTKGHAATGVIQI